MRTGMAMAIAAGLFTMAAAGAAPAGPVPLDAPHVALSNGTLAAKVWLPDPEMGFYRGTRFDWSGLVGSLTMGGQEFYGPWFTATAPDVRDFQYTDDGLVVGPASATMGPVEEYDPIGYEAAPVGGTFLKVGIGVLRKPDGKPYDHYRAYPIVDHGQWSVKHTATGITFTQDVRDPASGYGFHYVKDVTLAQTGPQMRIRHSLVNRGSKPFAITVYDHNFVRLAPGNNGIVITLPFAPKPDTAPQPALAKIEGNSIAYQRALTGKERVSFLITGYGDTPADYDFRVTNSHSGAAVRIQGDQPVARLNLWSIRSVMALEPYVAIDLAPGAGKGWTYTYTYTAPRRTALP
jgi:hypothetical protein